MKNAKRFSKLPEVSTLASVPAQNDYPNSGMFPLPAFNPMDTYKKLGVNVTQKNNVFMPNTYEDFQKGVDNGLNFGNSQLLNTYRNSAFNKNNFLQGVQGNQNFGNKFLANMEQQKGFFPTPTFTSPQDLQNNTTPINNTQSDIPVSYDHRRPSLLGKVGHFLGSPTGRGLMVAGLGLATGGGVADSLGYGFNTYAQTSNNINQDKTNRSLLNQQGVNTDGFAGYITDDRAKSISDNIYKQNYSKYRTGKLSIETREQLRKEGLTEAQIDKLEAETNYINGAKSDYTNAQTNNLETKTDFISKEYELKKKALEEKINNNAQKVAIAKQRAARGDSLAKQQLMQLSIESKNLSNQFTKLRIQNEQKYQDALNKGKTSRPASTIDDDPVGLY